MATNPDKKVDNTDAAVEATRNGFASGDTITNREVLADGSTVDSMGDGTLYVEGPDGIGYYVS